MRWLVLQGADRRLGVRTEGFVVELRGEPVQFVQPDEVEEVHVLGDATITPSARRLLLGRGIDVVFFTKDGRCIGRLSSSWHNAGARRMAQLRAVLDDPRRLAVARSIVEGKILNQHTALSRIQRQVQDERLAGALAALRASAARAGTAQTLDQLRGIEGYAAATYFGVFGLGVTNPMFTFEHRNRRPPRDPVNAVLSYLYTLLAVRCESAAKAAGLDPYVGFLHEAGRGYAACAFDLAEEWRPMVDALTLSLFNRRQLSPEDFADPAVDTSQVGAPVAVDAETSDGPAQAGPEAEARAVYLGPVGRGIVLTAWSRRLYDRMYHPGRGGRFAIADIFDIQAAMLARACEDAEGSYVPLRWR